MADRHAVSSEVIAQDLASLHWLEADAARGAKLGRRTDRLHAALHLAEAWKKARSAGVNKERFQDEVLEAMRSSHGRTESFKLVNYTLPRKFTEVNSEVIRHYTDRSEPSLRLEPYLAAIGLAASHCGADPAQWKMDMLRKTSLWRKRQLGGAPMPADGRDYETLAVLFDSLCSHIARRNGLEHAYSGIKAMNCRWEMFGDRLIASNENCMQWQDSPISPHYDIGEFLEEAVPYPSVPLLYVPYLYQETGFRLAPEEFMRKRDAEAIASGEFQAPGSLHPLPREVPYCVPYNVPGVSHADGAVTYYREIRLAVVPNGRGDFSAALQSRPRVHVSFPDDSPWAGVHDDVHGGVDPFLRCGLFYMRHADGGHVWPTIKASSGEIWRLEVDIETWNPESASIRDPDGIGWNFDADPVSNPGMAYAEPWYISLTGATPAHLRHWLDGEWALGEAQPVSCFARERNFAPDRYDTGLPARSEMLFPHGGPASEVEACLHNGLIEEGLDAAAAHLSRQVADLQTTHRAASEGHAQALLNRWRA